MVDIATKEPKRITAGDTLQWQRSFTDYPADDGWTLSYVLINAANKISITAAASGSDHLVTVAKATSADYVAGTYSWEAFVTSSTERHSVGSGIIIVDANPVAAATLDKRTHVKKVLDAIEDLLEGKVLSDVQEYTVEGRSLKKMSVPELITLRSKYLVYYQQELNKIEIDAGRKPKNKLKVRFV